MPVRLIERQVVKQRSCVSDVDGTQRRRKLDGQRYYAAVNCKFRSRTSDIFHSRCIGRTNTVGMGPRF